MRRRSRMPKISKYLPWSDQAGHYYPPVKEIARRSPAVVIYILISVVFFLPTARRIPGNYVTDQDRVEHLLFAIPDLSERFFLALRSLFTAPFFNHNAVQLVYVIALLLLFGIPFEFHEGTVRTIAIFFATSFAGALAAGTILHLIYPALIDTPFLQQAWERSWSGGSAGCFGLMGALAARAPRPWPLLGMFVTWEVAVVTFYLREYTPAFHMSALFAGFVLARFVIRPGATPRSTEPAEQARSRLDTGSPRRR